ncbi:MAG: YlmC/YmxH family sporulation protein [Oscillospiraceae bacterium]
MNISDLCELEVVSLASGVNLGRIDDFMLDEVNAAITHIVLFGHSKFFGLFGRDEDITVPWNDIVKIGEDVILVKGDLPYIGKRNKFFSFFSK